MKLLRHKFLIMEDNFIKKKEYILDIIPEEFHFLNNIDFIKDLETARASCFYCDWLTKEIKSCGLHNIYKSMELGNLKNIQVNLLINFIKGLKGV